jgi:hypothetical protein
MQYMSSLQEDEPPQETSPPSPGVLQPLTFHDLLIDDVHIPTVQFAAAPTEDWLSANISNVDPNFIDFQEHSDGGRPSSYDDMQESEKEDDDKSYFNAIQNLEDVLWPADVLHNSEGLVLPLLRYC